MIVLTLTDCPPALRGDLTRWLFEVDTNLYVGNLSSRVREKLWERVTQSIRGGRAVLVFPANNEQGFDFRIFGQTWQPIDFDGLKLMLRPDPGRAQAAAPPLKPGFSKAAHQQMARRMAAKPRPPAYPEAYCVVDVETTGLSPDADAILEIGALAVRPGAPPAEFQALLRIDRPIPSAITQLTGITEDALRLHGRPLSAVLADFIAFLGDLPIVSHNVTFDLDFLGAALRQCGLPELPNRPIDTLRMARKFLDNPPNFKLATLAEYLALKADGAHRSLGDCATTTRLYEHLRRIAQGEGGEDGEA
jgi:CRISPR-associated protein Cas2